MMKTKNKEVAVEPESQFTGMGGEEPYIYEVIKGYCPRCGSIVNQEQKYCSNCGQKLRWKNE